MSTDVRFRDVHLQVRILLNNAFRYESIEKSLRSIGFMPMTSVEINRAALRELLANREKKFLRSLEREALRWIAEQTPSGYRDLLGAIGKRFSENLFPITRCPEALLRALPPPAEPRTAGGIWLPR